MPVVLKVSTAQSSVIIFSEFINICLNIMTEAVLKPGDDGEFVHDGCL